MQERMAGCWTREKTKVLIGIWSDESIRTVLDSVAGRSCSEADVGAGLPEKEAVQDKKLKMDS